MHDAQVEKCPECGGVKDECLCCLGCGHICPLDMGEPFCPICKPESLQKH